MIELMTVADVSRGLGVSRQQVWRLVRSGRLPARMVGRCYLVSRANYERMVAWRKAMMDLRRKPEGRRKRNGVRYGC
jgi:excisionase family DNA binding protein